MVRLIASLTLLLLCTGCQAGAPPPGTAMGAREPHVRLWGPPDNIANGAGGGGGGGGGM